jgi:hypothetical protein
LAGQGRRAALAGAGRASVPAAGGGAGTVRHGSRRHDCRGDRARRRLPPGPRRLEPDRRGRRWPC